jgi:hypothetical protein
VEEQELGLMVNLRKVKKWMNPARTFHELDLRIHWGLSRMHHARNIKRLHAFENKPCRERPVFILGPPRCGSTLLYQVMLHTFRFAYFQNRMEKYKYSVAEYTLDHVDPDEPFQSDFKSRYGRTVPPNGPHEGGFFWRRFFKREIHDYMGANRLSPDAVFEITNTIQCLQTHFDASFLSKNLMMAMRIQTLHTLFPDAVYIIVHRDPVATASSMAAARVYNRGNKETWFSVRPAEYHDLVKQPYHFQVAGQVAAIYRTIYQDLRPGDSVIELSYERLCDNPSVAVEWIGQEMESKGLRLRPRGNFLPDSFPIRKDLVFSRDELNDVNKYLASGVLPDQMSVYMKKSELFAEPFV